MKSTLSFQERQAEQLGASVFGPNEIYVKLKSFKKGITGDTGKMYNDVSLSTLRSTNNN